MGTLIQTHGLKHGAAREEQFGFGQIIFGHTGAEVCYRDNSIRVIFVDRYEYWRKLVPVLVTFTCCPEQNR